MPREVSATVIETFILLSCKIIYGNTGRGNRFNETVFCCFCLLLFSPFAQ